MIDLKEEKFLAIKKEIMNDPMNENYTRQGIEPLFRVSSASKILIIGQAPGWRAEQTRITWNDESGNRLIGWLGVPRETFFNTDLFGQMPMDFYYPGKGKTGDLPPRKGFAEKWHSRILSLLPNVELIILIGSYSQEFYLKDRRTLTERLKHYQEYLPRYFLLVHPSPLNFRWHKMNPWFQEEVLPSLRKKIQELLRA